MRRRGAGIVATIVAMLLSVAPAGAVAGFGDVATGSFYAPAVQWMVDNHYTTGTSPGCFSPGLPTTRGEVATFIHRMEGRPSGSGEPFVDVRAADFFAESVSWMYSIGATRGTSPTTFEPYRMLTRGELAVFLHRAAGSPAGGAEPFVDVEDVHFFAAAVAWMVSTGITEGATPTTFEPERLVTRGELAAFLHRMHGEPAVELTPPGVCGEESPTELAQAEAHSLLLLNQLRSGMGLGPLVRDPSLDAFARDWSEEMDRTDDFRHSSAAQRSQVGARSENIAWWSANWAEPEAAAARLHDLWVGSSGHHRNMTGAGWNRVGIGFWHGPDGWHATHVFS